MTTVYFATNRNPSRREGEYFGERFHPDGPQFYRVGKAEVDRVSDDFDEGFAVRTVEVNPERTPNIETRRGGLLGSSKLFREIRHEAQRDALDTLVLLPGFANTFVNNLQRAAQIKEQFRIMSPAGGDPREPLVVVFSWPSNGRIVPPWEYHSDRDDAAVSGLAIARFFLRFRDFLDELGRCEQRVHLVAHSMGNWALRHALLGIRDEIGERTNRDASARLPVVFDNALLMAADEDDNALETADKLGLLTEVARAVHVYHSAGDRVLTISDTTKFNPARLGSDGPRTFSGLTTRIVAIDCSKVDFTTAVHLNHQYYRIRSEVAADVGAVLSGRHRPDEIPGRVVVESGRRYRIEP
jgi:esterase/lipase superfamily enzyme